MNRRLLTLSFAALSFAAMLPASHAQTAAWPDKPVKLELSQPAGSGPDNVARLVSERLARAWSQPVIIDNKPGGQNTIGAQFAARSPADGTTFYFATTAAQNMVLFWVHRIFKSERWLSRCEIGKVRALSKSRWASSDEVECA